MELFDEYDRNKLEKAKQILIEVYEYNYGVPIARKRLETILAKIDYLITLAE